MRIDIQEKLRELKHLRGLKGRVQNSLSGFLRACVVALLVAFQFDVEDGYREDMAAFLDAYRENVDPDINYLSSQAAVANAEGIRDMILFVGRLVGIIFGIAGIL